VEAPSKAASSCHCLWNRRFFDSSGERARLLVDLVAMAAPHLLILDEPTIISTSTAAGRSWMR
jgi:energy-coupling factor transporter ATP-binding protein EcfA2